MRKRALVMLGVALPLLSGCGMWNGNHADLTSPQGFMVEAAAARAKEEATARIAIQRAHDPQLRAYASRVLADAQADDPKLAVLAQRYNVAFPAPITPEDQTDINTMTDISAGVFDKFYADQSMADERDMLDMYTAASRRNTQDIADYAQGYRGTLRTHFDAATSIDAAVGGQTYNPLIR